LSMQKVVKMPKCSCCARNILPGEEAVSFPCPNCASVTIWRCAKCRKFGRPYKCARCGFEGP